MIVMDLMTKETACVGVYESLASAAQRMWQQDCGALPVIHEDGSVVGMITDRDICMATWSRGSAPAALTVRDAMSTSIVTCRPGDSLREVEAAMRSSQVRRLPVVDDEQRLIGIVSLADIARADSNSGLGFTLAGICQRASTPSALSARS
jgi:CBS domain-containing protein